MLSSSESWLNPFGIDAPGLCECVCVWGRKCAVETAETVCVHACMRSLIKALQKATTSGLCDQESSSPSTCRILEPGPSSPGFISPSVESHSLCLSVLVASLLSYPINAKPVSILAVTPEAELQIRLKCIWLPSCCLRFSGFCHHYHSRRRRSGKGRFRNVVLLALLASILSKSHFIRA